VAIPGISPGRNEKEEAADSDRGAKNKKGTLDLTCNKLSRPKKQKAGVGAEGSKCKSFSHEPVCTSEEGREKEHGEEMVGGGGVAKKDLLRQKKRRK